MNEHNIVPAPAPLDIVSRVYESAASAGLLKRCVWLQNHATPLEHFVGLRAPDDSVLENLTRSKETTISYPVTIFIGLRAGETVELEGQRFQVREIKAVGDGAELRARLTRL
jgi:hypothetical protein